ncbi:MAG: valine--tRNA ligase [Chloroflexi bacterium]|nr:MAG: valine--tRNA ligase [Chloroflexota bacterium]
MTNNLQELLGQADLAKPYEARQIERRLYAWWESCGYFQPRFTDQNRDRRPFVISMPPPNVTGILHTGHAMMLTIEDILIRWHRMLGDPTLWVPGTDHAGIATQAVVEKNLAQEGKTRHDLGREQFLAKVWEWKELKHSTITDQICGMGSSCDWNRERFTLDEGLSHAVRVAFKRLYDDGLIYRAEYLVNWCPKDQTVISDLEVEHEERQGHLWHIRYYLADELGDWRGGSEPDRPHITVATTRPETLLGDTAIAVHPEDERYTGLIGREALLPALGRRIPIIADDTVDRSFGTGAVKITPAHDPNDYELGKRHNLPFINIMNKDATINEQGGPYAGLDRYAARKQLVADLEAAGNLEKIQPHQLNVGTCSRCDTVIEPRLSLQWWVKMEPLAKPAIASVREGRIRIVPEFYERVYFHWLENIQDWPISRQLWWGHRIPVWYCASCNSTLVEIDDPGACGQCGSSELRQDEDVLDTWFSSGLWPFSTLGWPEQTDDLKTFYPTSVMETGYDILFFWVARMIFMGLYLTGQEPFHTVYLHGLVRDEHNRKISKSLGNAPDPLKIIEQYGTDALRYMLATSSTPGQDFSFQPTRIEAARNFANKLWNITRFVVGKLGEERAALQPLTALNEHTLADRWIVSRYQQLSADVDRLMNAYNLGEAGRQIETFLWDDFADWYLETAKVQLEGDIEQQQRTRGVLHTVLEGTLRLLHPFMPFVTEAAWQHLTAGSPGRAEALMIAPYPQSDAAALDAGAERDWTLVQEIVRGIRNVRNESGVEPARWIEAVIVAGDRQPLLEAQRPIISRLARVAADKLDIVAGIAVPPANAATLVAGGMEVFLPLAGMVDLAEERARLSKELERAQADLERRQSKLANESFTSRAPAPIVQKERDALAETETVVAKLRDRITALG